MNRSIHPPRISIVVPMYNAESTVDLCLSSILNQKYTDFELIVVNDGSTDGSQSICESFVKRDSRVKLLVQANNGVSSARNHGIENATGEWITFADSDDWVEPYWLELFINNISTGVDLVAQGYTWHHSAENTSNLIFNCSGELDVRSAVNMFHEMHCLGYVWNKAFNRAKISECNNIFSIHYKILEDEDFVLRYLSQCVKVSIASGKGAYHYFEPANAKKYHGMMNADCCFGLLNSARRIYENDAFEAPVYLGYINAICRKITESIHGNRLESLRHIEGLMGVMIVDNSFPVFRSIELIPLNLLRINRSLRFWIIIFGINSFCLKLGRKSIHLASMMKQLFGCTHV